MQCQEQSREGDVSLSLLERSGVSVTSQSGSHSRQILGAFTLLHLSVTGTAPREYKFCAKVYSSITADLWKAVTVGEKAHSQRRVFKNVWAEPQYYLLIHQWLWAGFYKFTLKIIWRDNIIWSLLFIFCNQFNI